jgi:SAM-dependent methyltransferase
MGSMSSDNTGTVCRVCGAGQLVQIFESPGEMSFTSAQVPVPVKIRVSFCRSCGHAQTPPLEAISDYYDTGYNFRNRDPDEDDIYIATTAGVVFRSQHQTLVIEEKIDLDRPLRILDYGCGKASSLRQLTERHPKIVPYAFDVSEAYLPAWTEFIDADNYSSYDVPKAWDGQLDVVLSLFALEHVDDPRGFVKRLRELLRPDGQVHLIVPHLYRNMSDLLVADHVNHFSVSSIRRLFEDAGFADIRVDTESHRAALVVNASLGSRDEPVSRVAPADIVNTEREAKAIAAHWVASVGRLRDYERSGSNGNAAIYGSGVYGLFIASTLTSLEKIAYFVDVNPYRQGLQFLGRRVIAPEELGDDVRVILVGLNPQYASSIVEQSAPLQAIEREFIFL